MKRIIFGGILGALVAYFFDPENGPRRRNEARDKLGATARDQAGQIDDLKTVATDKAKGLAAEATRRKRTEYNDETLSEKVKTELYADPEMKGKVVVNVEHGVVQLRGELQQPDEIDKAVGTARGVAGVKAVENLLHLPGAPARTS